MIIISLDKIVKNMLLKRRYPIHFYLDFIVYAKDGLRQIAMDDIQTIRYQALPVNQTGNTVDFPNDYLDYVRVSAWVDQYIHPLVEDNSLQLVPNYDSNFDIQPYSDGVAGNPSSSQFYPTGYLYPFWWANNTNAFGENMGRMFGGVGAKADTFRVDKAKRQFKINEFLTIDYIVLEYVSNGLDADSATHIDAYAQDAIESYVLWQHYLHNRTYSQGEANNMEEKYLNQRQILRARVSDITMDKLKRIVQSNNVAIKY